MTDEIYRWVHDNRNRIIECVRDLVRIETQNLAPHGNEQKGQMAVVAMLNALGCEVDVYEIGSVPGLLEHPRYWSARPCTGRPNVMGIRGGTGGGRSLMFSGHIDTVPVGPDSWSRDPWGGEVSDGKLWGIGSYDMKAGLAAAIMTVKALNDLGLRLKGDLMIESVVDEEFGGCNGTLAARLKYNADLAIVPEPTNLVVCPAHHGGLMLRVTFRGKSGWGFSPERPVDPIHALARFIVLLNEWAAQRISRLAALELYRHDPSLPVLVNQLKAGDVSLPFFGDRVPSEAWLSVWIEVYPGMSLEDVMHDLRTYYDAVRQRDPMLAAFEPEWKPVRWLDGSQIAGASNHAGVKMLADVVTQVRGQPAVVQGAPFACDGHMFNLYSPTPMVLLGPTGGQPHAPDEFIVIEDYLQLVEVFVRATIAWCGVE